MPIKKTVMVVVSSIFAATCIALGFWQIRRLHEKQEYNARLSARRFLDAVPLGSLPADTGASKFRRVKLEGRYDYANQIVWTLRGRDGSPGVNILTPLRRAGTDTAILVNRGWVYSPDATHADLTTWNEADSLVGEGYILPLHATGSAESAVAGPRAFRFLDARALGKVFPYPVAPVFAVLTTPGDSTKTPPRVTLIPLDEGSHRSYAFQWFSFAAISIIGAAIFTRKT